MSVHKPIAIRSVLLAALTLVAACSTMPPVSPRQARSDENTADRVYAALNADPTYYYRHVDVRVDAGVAHLSGYVWSADALFRAKKIAAAVPGITNVVNEMELERQGQRGGAGGHNG